jgi:hypothetical protein
MRYTQKHPQHTYVKRGVYYFSRVVPSDLKHHYSKPRIIQSLKTKSAHRASTASKMLSAKLDDYWLGLRLKQKEDIVCLPVHDAIGVQQGHEDWAKEVMLETWQEHAKGVGTMVKVDYPHLIK